jgi:hypothetical protein
MQRAVEGTDAPFSRLDGARSSRPTRRWRAADWFERSEDARSPTRIPTVAEVLVQLELGRGRHGFAHEPFVSDWRQDRSITRPCIHSMMRDSSQTMRKTAVMC